LGCVEGTPIRYFMILQTIPGGYWEVIANDVDEVIALGLAIDADKLLIEADRLVGDIEKFGEVRYAETDAV